MSGNVLARLTALGVMTIQDFKQHWHDLFNSERPAYSDRFLESQLAYQIQELAYDRLRPETMQRLEALSQQLDGSWFDVHGKRADHDRSISGMRLIREWQGDEHTVKVDHCGRHKLGILASSQELSESPPSPAGFRRFGGAHGPFVHAVAAPCREG